MGDWSEYFADFPEEDPANWIDGRFDPRAARIARTVPPQTEQEREDAIRRLRKQVAKAQAQVKTRSLLATEACPQCGVEALNMYRISDRFFLCECQECGIYGSGRTRDEALARTYDAIGEGLDWRHDSPDDDS